MHLLKRIVPALLLTMILSAPAMAQTIDYAFVSTHGFDTLDQSDYDAIGKRIWFFTHASVGGNMLDGMDVLHNSDPTKYQLTTPTASTTSLPSGDVVPGSVYDANRGNPGWQSKYDIFRAAVEAGWGNAADFVMDKLCYIDQAADAQVYLQMMEDLDSKHPATFVYATLPIKTSTDRSNDLRNIYNRAVRDYCKTHGKLLFDIADLEAHDAAGNEYTYISSTDGQTYQRMYSGWTGDGGHLDAEGRVWVARAWYVLAAYAETPPPLAGMLMLLLD